MQGPPPQRKTSAKALDCLSFLSRFPFWSKLFAYAGCTSLVPPTCDGIRLRMSEGRGIRGRPVPSGSMSCMSGKRSFLIVWDEGRDGSILPGPEMKTKAWEWEAGGGAWSRGAGCGAGAQEVAVPRGTWCFPNGQDKAQRTPQTRPWPRRGPSQRHNDPSRTMRINQATKTGSPKVHRGVFPTTGTMTRT